MKQQGLSYLEVMIATLLITVSLVPAMDALYSGLRGSDQANAALLRATALQQRMETLLAADFRQLGTLADTAADPTLAQPDPWSDPAGSQPRILVYLSRYDGDNADGDNNPFTGTETDLLWIRVADEQGLTALETIRHD
jgi:type II secretory pathway component PulJ